MSEIMLEIILEAKAKKPKEKNSHEKPRKLEKTI